MSTNAVQQVVYGAVVAIHCGQLSANKVPAVIRIPRNANLTVMQKRDDDSVAGEDEARNTPVTEQAPDTVNLREFVEEIRHASQTRERSHAAKSIPGEYGASDVIVADITGCITHGQITKPTQPETKPRHGVSPGARLRLLDRVVHLIFIEVGVVFVVNLMGEFPHVVRAQKEGVHHGTDNVVQQGELGERAVSAVVPNYKYGGEKCALDSPVEKHGHHAEQSGWYGL